MNPLCLPYSGANQVIHSLLYSQEIRRAGMDWGPLPREAMDGPGPIAPPSSRSQRTPPQSPPARNCPPCPACPGSQHSPRRLCESHRRCSPHDANPRHPRMVTLGIRFGRHFAHSGTSQRMRSRWADQRR